MADFRSWPVHKTGTVTTGLSRLDGLLRASGLSAGLTACLTVAGGPLHDEAARRGRDLAGSEPAGNHPDVAFLG